MLRSTRMRLASAVALAIGGIARANAYIDPGTGSVQLQMISAAIAGGIFYFHELSPKIACVADSPPKNLDEFFLLTQCWNEATRLSECVCKCCKECLLWAKACSSISSLIGLAVTSKPDINPAWRQTR